MPPLEETVGFARYEVGPDFLAEMPISADPAGSGFRLSLEFVINHCERSTSGELGEERD